MQVFYSQSIVVSKTCGIFKSLFLPLASDVQERDSLSSYSELSVLGAIKFIFVCFPPLLLSIYLIETVVIRWFLCSCNSSSTQSLGMKLKHDRLFLEQASNVMFPVSFPFISFLFGILFQTHLYGFLCNAENSSFWNLL